ncbi:hypothetical protein REPUB_Repub02eG0171100 [Reevesia pubescens]
MADAFLSEIAATLALKMVSLTIEELRLPWDLRRFRIAQSIMDIRERLDEIAADKSKFRLMKRVDSRRIVHREREMTHSFIRPSDVI